MSKRKQTQIEVDILELARKKGAQGITSNDIVSLTDYPLQTVSGRLARMKRDGKLVATSRRRRGAADPAKGAGAKVLVLPEYAPAESEARQ